MQKTKPIIKQISAFILTVFLFMAMPVNAKIRIHNTKKFIYDSTTSDGEFNKQLLLSEVEINAITNASHYHEGNTPMTFQNINKNTLSQNNLTQDLPYVLQQTTSLVAYSDAGNGVGYTGLRLRGTDLTRINVTLNGVPYNDAEGQGVYFVDIPDIANYANKVQIQRGVGSSSNGGTAFGGGINLSTSNNNTKPSLQYSLSIGAFNSIKNNLFLSSGLLKDKWQIDLAASINKSNGYVDRASSDLLSLFTSIIFKPKQNIQLKFNYLVGSEKTYHAWNGVIDTLLAYNRTFNSAGLWITDEGKVKANGAYPNQTDNYTQHHFQLFYTQKINQNISLNNTVFCTLGKGFYEEYKFGNIKPLFKTDTNYIRQLWLDNIFYGNLLSLNYYKKNTNIKIGINAQRYEGKHYGIAIWVDGKPEISNKQWYALTAFKNDFNGFLKLEQRLYKTIHIYADAQLRSVQYRMNGFRKSPDTLREANYLFFNPKIGISYATKNVKGFASFSIGQKEPNRSDFENRRDLPSPELLQDLEIGNTINYKNFSYTNTLFGMFYRNQLILDGSIDDVGNYLRQNISKSYRLGVENEFMYHINNSQNKKLITISGNFTWSINKILNYEDKIIDYESYAYKTKVYTQTDISFSPNIISAFQIDYSIFDINFNNNKSTIHNDMHLLLKGKYVDKQFLDNTSNDEKSLNAYYTQDLSLSYNISSTSPSLSFNIIAGINNVFNKLYEANGYTYSYYYGNELNSHNYYYPMMGRNYYIKLSMNL